MQASVPGISASFEDGGGPQRFDWDGCDKAFRVPVLEVDTLITFPNDGIRLSFRNMFLW